MSEPQTWVPLGDEAHGLISDNRIVAIAYAENVGPLDGPGGPTAYELYELWWVPVDAPNVREVLFGVGEGTPEWWDNRWDRAKNATESLYREWLENR